MRRYFLAAGLVAGIAAGALMPGSAGAMTLAAPAALGQAAQGTAVTKAAYVCRRWWSYGRWHRRCYWRSGPYAYYGYGSPRYRHWHHRRWYHHRWHYY